ncbi:Uncharacterized protein DBV15_04226 [Temnothorax longispinosus]|uniref:Uncharacterized protein n=1 Tax=Temnothorax longispinosus TaxID=300112 RepID=A0A4S2KMD7_9HYME|nr:Uncharacterized protein DBV15_04226 [Temnothorax longispinosus]
MTIPTKKAPPPRVGRCQPQKMIMNSKSSVINTELSGHVDETKTCETGKSIHQTNESVMPYPPLPLLSDVIRLLAFSPWSLWTALPYKSNVKNLLDAIFTKRHSIRLTQQ